jgi:hypothetical protein
MPNNHSDAYSDGYLAVADSYTNNPGLCPFPPDSQEAADWRAGVEQRRLEDAQEWLAADMADR